MALEVGRGALAHEVDDARRVARAIHEARRALEDFHAVVDGSVGDAVVVAHVAAGRGQAGHAIELEVLDLEAPGIEAVALGVVAVDRDAGRLPERVRDAGQALVVHLLAGDDGDGLRCFPLRERQPGGGAGAAGGVAARALGGATAYGSGRYAHFAQSGAFTRQLGQFLQQVAPVGALHQLQAAAGEQPLQCFARRVATHERRALPPVRKRRVERQRHAYRGCHLGQRPAQRARGDLIGLDGRGSLNRQCISRKRGRHACQRPAQQGKACRMGNGAPRRRNRRQGR